MSSDENEDLCDYQIVEFISRGRPGVRKIDLVPIKWIEYDIKKGKLMTKFMPPPYEEEDFKLITNLAKKLADAPNDWVTYGIKFRARAKTYADGCAKLKSLEDQLYAFTDSGADPEKIAANIEESLKTQTLKQQLRNLKASMTAVTAIPEQSKTDTSRLTGKRKHIGSQSQLQLPIENVHDSTKIDEFYNNTSKVIPIIKDATMTIQKFVGTVKEATDTTKHSKFLSKSRT
ncbi:uncharacterized protein LOC109862561 isoform X2 [Pseudomyrmex gracilis]|uniref:uncharacterized protein LOC109862561 isoform X2 n=1 Tax=Pseudomyrmex gracilis TaxID=219809 RepID=UPI00099502E1|nr:uncharacterized protein LOC109862561 isoform X2 [Pseudomyrmex gracilis]